MPYGSYAIWSQQFIHMSYGHNEDMYEKQSERAIWFTCHMVTTFLKLPSKSKGLYSAEIGVAIW